MMIVYENNSEVLVCEASHENTLKREYFENGGRDYDDYSRSVSIGTVEINSRMHVSADQIVG